MQIREAVARAWQTHIHAMCWSTAGTGAAMGGRRRCRLMGRSRLFAWRDDRKVPTGP